MRRLNFLIILLGCAGWPMRSANAELASVYALAVADHAEHEIGGFGAHFDSVARLIGSLPAAGDMAGILVFVCALLLFTDILGLTRIYTFTLPAT